MIGTVANIRFLMLRTYLRRTQAGKLHKQCGVKFLCHVWAGAVNVFGIYRRWFVLFAAGETSAYFLYHVLLKQ